MSGWKKRAPEIANLLNPAFCAVILYSTVCEYQKKAQKDFPLTLLYLVLPIVLHKDTRNRISSRTNMIAWMQNYPDVLIGFAERAKNLVVFTNEAFEFLLYQEIFDIVSGQITITKTISQSRINKYMTEDQEIGDCIKKAAHVGRWFSGAKSEANIYAAWGVRP